MNNDTFILEPEHDVRNVPGGIVVLIIALIGIIGNILTILALGKSPKLRSYVITTFVIWLSVADTVYCTISLPALAFTFINGGSRTEGLVCSLSAYLLFGLAMVPQFLLVMITMNRYIMIVHFNMYKTVYTASNVTAMLVFCWVFPYVVQIPPLFGIWGKFAYDPELTCCYIVEDDNKRNSRAAIFMATFMIPSLVIIISYTRIFWVVRSSRKRMKRHSRNNQSCENVASVSNKKQEWQVTKLGLVVFIAFISCYLPNLILRSIESNEVHGVGIPEIIIVASGAINPFIYIIMNKEYRDAYKKLLNYDRFTIGRRRPFSSQLNTTPSTSSTSASGSTRKPSIVKYDPSTKPLSP